MSKKVLTIGGATRDIYLHYQGADSMTIMESGNEKNYMLFESGAKIEVEKVLYHTGGGATNSAVSFKRMGFDAACFCMIGQDTSGTMVMQDLQKEGVDASYVATSKEVPSGKSFVVNSLSRERTIFAYRGANACLSKKLVPFDCIKEADLIYITSLSNSSSKILGPVVQHAKEHDVMVAMNPGVSQLARGTKCLKESLACIDCLILNSSEAKTFMGALVASNKKYKKVFESDGQGVCDDDVACLLKMPMYYENLYFSIRNFFKEVLKMGPKIVVVTDGEKGVYVAEKERVFFHPSIKTDVVDTLGAGDSFGSCFVGCIAHGFSIEDALRAGVINSSSVIGHMGAKPGLLHFVDIKQGLENLDKDMLKIYEL